MAETPDAPAETSTPFLASDPPPLAARGLSLFLISFFVVTVLLAALVKIPETVSATFVLVPLRGTDPVRAPRGGTITKASVNESARVAKGALLYLLRSPGAADRTADLQTEIAREAGAQAQLVNLRKKYQAETLSAEEELKRLLERSAFLDRMVALKKEQLSLSQGQVERTHKLQAQGLGSIEDQNNAEIRHSQTAMEFEQTQTDRRENRSAVEKLRLTESARRTAFGEEERALVEKIAASRIKIEALSGEQGGSASGELDITAPCDGTILRLDARNVGAIVREGDSLCEIACTGDRLQAELTLPQGGLSQVSPGQPVKLLYQAFPYQRFGVKNGIVRWASPAGTTSTAGKEPTTTFRAFAELNEQSIQVEGESRPLLPGMRGNALLVVGRRSAISYAFAPLRQLQETMK